MYPRVVPDLPTRAEYFDIGAGEIRARSAARPPGFRVNPEVVFVEGTDLNIINASASAMADEVTRQVGIRAKILLLNGADGEDLDRLVADRFSPTIVRKQASPSVDAVQITRNSGVLPAVNFPVGTRFTTPGGVEFATTVAASILLGSHGPVSIPVQALVAGTQGNVDVNTITQFVQAPADPALQVTNEEPAAGGDDRETDARLRARARDFFRTARRGTLSAIEFGALTVPGIRQATAIEETDGTGLPTGRVFLYVADALGQANSVLVAAVRTALVEYRAAGIIVDISGSIPTFVPIRFRLRFDAGVDTTRAAALVRNATVAAVNALAPNRTLTVALLFSVARSVQGVIVLDDAILEPVGDLVPEAGHIIRTRADLVSFE